MLNETVGIVMIGALPVIAGLVGIFGAKAWDANHIEKLETELNAARFDIAQKQQLIQRLHERLPKHDSKGRFTR